MRLNPHETRALDLRKLRDAQQPDLNKNTIPAAATDGSVIWVRADNVPVMGRLMLIHRRQGMASNYDCDLCSCPLNYTPNSDYINPGSSNLLVLGQVPLIFYSAYVSCNMTYYYYNTTASAAWSSQYSNIASVNSGTVKGVSGGTSLITAQYSDYGNWVDYPQLGCQGSLLNGNVQAPTTEVSVTVSGAGYVPLRNGTNGAHTMPLTATGTPSGGTYSWTTTSGNVSLTGTTSSQVTVTAVVASMALNDTPITVTYTLNGSAPSATVNITVVRPTSLSLQSDTTNGTGHTCVGGTGTNTCTQSYFSGTGSYTSYLRNRTYHVMDQFGRWIAGYSMDLEESYTTPTGQCASNLLVTGGGTGDTVTDCFYFCSSTCQSQGSCSVSATQTGTANGFTVLTESVNWTCSGVSLSP